jgi:predicted nicotinamide N-methyase
MIADPAAFIRNNTALIAPPLVPEVRLHLATEVVPLWRRTEEELDAEGVPPPYWAFAWAGGQALARYLLDHTDVIREKRVLDFGSGSGLVAIAAAIAGARQILAADIDPFAAKAIAMNSAANFPPSHFAGEVACDAQRRKTEGAGNDKNTPLRLRRLKAGVGTSPALRGRKIEITSADIIDAACAWDVILVGDMCYERPLAERLLRWLSLCAESGATVFLGDPGRSYFPESGVVKLATYRVQTTRELEDRDIRETSVYLYSGSVRP